MKPFEVDTGGLDRSVWPFFVKPSKKGFFFSELKDVEGKVSDEFFVLGIFAKDQNLKVEVKFILDILQGVPLLVVSRVMNST